jgi:hypothetical protein
MLVIVTGLLFQMISLHGKKVAESTCQMQMSNYSSQFHPTTILKCHLRKILEKLVNTSDPKLWPNLTEFEFTQTGVLVLC